MDNPLFKKLPKIGIRPAIDGRLGGVRESLETQTMDLAKSVARLIGEKLRYPNGKPVECVIADTCIGGVAEAAACAEKFAREGVGLSLTVTPCWCYGSETMDMDSADSQSGVGFQRHGAARRGLSGGGAGRPFAKGIARLRHLRTRRAGRRRQDDSRPTCRKKFCASVAPAWPSPSMRGKSYLAWAAFRWALPARLWTRHFLKVTWA